MPDEQVVQTPEQIETESSAALDKGFASARGEEPPVVAKPAEEKAPEPEAAKPEPEKPAEEKPAEPDRFAEVKAQLDSVTGRLRKFEGHVGTLIETTNGIKAALDSAKAVEKTGGEAPTQAEIQRSSESTARWKQLKEDFPEWAAEMEEMEKRLAEGRAAKPEPIDVAGIRSEVETAVTKDIDERIAAAKSEAEEFAYVRFKHPTWKQTVQTPEFRAWHDAQTPEIKALASSANGDDAVRMLDAYEADRAKAAKEQEKKEANERRLKNSVQPKGQAPVSPPPPNEDDALDRGFKKARSGA